MLKRFFTAKWQHKNTSIRQQALTDFDPLKDAEIIKQMVTDDPSLEVRNLALAKLKDPNELLDLLNQANEPYDWLTYAVRINEISPQIESLVNSFNAIKVKWNNEQINKAIAGCKLPELVNALLVTIEDSKILFEMALNAKSIEVRLDAVNKIEEHDELHRLLKESNNKLVIRAIKQKLAEVKAVEKHHAELHQNADNFVLAMEKLSQQSWLDHQYEIKVKSLVDKWQQIEKELSLTESTLTQTKIEQPSSLEKDILQFKLKFLSALDICYDRILKNQNELQQAHLKQDAINKNKALTEQLKKLVIEINEPVEDGKTSLEKFQSIKSAAEFLQKSWNQTIEITQPEAKIRNEFFNSSQELQSYFAAWEQLTEIEPKIIQHISLLPDENFVAQKKWLEIWGSLEKKIAWPTKINTPDLLLNWIETVKDIQDKHRKLVVSQKKKAAYINQKLKLLEKECQRKNLLAANKLSNYIDLQLAALTPDFRATIESKIEKIQPQLEELRDWHSFATTPKKQVLCEAMESLQIESIDPLEKANKVRNLQQQWRELKASNAVADEALWDRFKQASDIAYLPCLAFYAEQDKIKADNLDKKIQICEQLDNLIKENHWCLSEFAEGDNHSEISQETAVNWKSIDKLIVKLNQDWKKLQPVPENERLSIQHHYDSATQVIRDNIKKEKQANLDLRLELVEKASLLVNIEDIDKAIKSALLLQNQWKKIGLTFFKADREQWTLFRQAIDKVFNKRDQLNKSHKEELKINQKKITEITQQITELVKTPDLELRGTYAVFEQLKSSIFIESDLPKSNATKLLNHFEKACSTYQNHFDRLEQRLQKLKIDSLITAGVLLQNAEEKILTSSVNLISSEKEQLENEFNQLYLDHHDKNLLNIRLQKIIDNQQIQDNAKGTNQLLKIALDLEILLSIESPPQYTQRRMAIQLEKLKEGMGTTLQESDKKALLNRALRTWLSIGFIAPSIRLELESRRVKIYDGISL